MECLHEPLTPAETNVLRALLGEDGVREIAHSLGCAELTVRTHLKRIHSKTHTHTLLSLEHFVIHHAACCLPGLALEVDHLMTERR